MKLVLGRQNPTFSVTVTQLRVNITYSKATVSVVIDDRGLNKYARDYVNELDRITIAIDKGLVTSQDVVDSIAELALQKQFADDYSTDDSVFVSAGFVRDYEELVAHGDAISELLVVKDLIDTASASHVPSNDYVWVTDYVDSYYFDGDYVSGSPASFLAHDTKILIVKKALIDSVTVIDNADANSGDGLEYTDIKPSSDDIGVTDSANSTFGKQLVDNIGTADVFEQAFAKPLTDSVLIGELSTLAMDIAKSDSLSLSDTFSRVFNANLTQSDSFLTNDTLASIGVAKLLTDAISAVSAGSLRMTSYVDITYLAEDYVGTSITFS